MFRGSVKSTGYPLHSPISPSLPLPCVTVCHHISTGLYLKTGHRPSIQALNYPAHHSQSASHHISSNNTPTIKTTSPVTINKSRGEKKNKLSFSKFSCDAYNTRKEGQNAIPSTNPKHIPGRAGYIFASASEEPGF